MAVPEPRLWGLHGVSARYWSSLRKCSARYAQSVLYNGAGD